jgi:alpha-D-xyloside xylohydrolase
MRSMHVEFPDDPICDTLDRHYMLGESILVAPIFNKEGHASYYLPKGKWTHLLSGEVKEGGTWIKETYDFMSLPLFVRDNTVLPIGHYDVKPVYDYLENLTLKAYHIDKGTEITLPVYITNGDLGATFTVHHTDEIKIQADQDVTYQVEVISD